MESWGDDNFELKEVTPANIIPTNKWEGEDEEDDVKDNWEDEDEEPKVQESKAVISTKPKKKNDKIAEKEKLKEEEREKQQKELEENDELSPEERLRLQKESDLQVALDTFGETTFGESNTNIGPDAMNPVSKEEFEELADAIALKVQPLSKSSEFPAFAESIVRNICASMSSLDIKKIKNTIDNLYLEKQKIEKGDKARKSKGKGKAKLKIDNENQYSAYVDDYDDYDDFM